MSSPPRRSRFRRIVLRALLVLGIGLVLGIAAGGWWAWNHGEDWLERKVRERIATIIEDASVPGYTFSMDDLLVDTRTGHLQVTNVELDFEPELLDSLRNGDFRYLFAARAGRIELRGLSFWRLVLFSEFKVGAFELMQPEISYLISGKRVDLTDPFARLEQGSGPSISLVRADTFLIHNAQATVEDLGGDLPRMSLSNLRVEGDDVIITMGELRRGVRLELGDASLAFDSLLAQLPDGDVLSIGRTRLSRSKRSGLVEHFSLVPAAQDSTDLERPRRAVIDLSIDSIWLHGFDVDHLIAYQALRIGHLELLDARMRVELDKSLAEVDPVLRPLPTMALRELSFMIQVDTLSFRRASVLYRERDAATMRWGEVPFDRLDGSFMHVTNFGPAILEHPRIEGGFSGLLFDSARIAGRYTAELDGSDRFTLMATATDLPLKNLNSATRPMLRVQVNAGTLHRMDLHMEGDDRRAKGDLALHYSDLLVRVEPGTPRELRHSMFGSVVETMLKEAYGGGLSADRSRTWSIDRDPYRSMITYMWHGVREGLARNLAPEAMERMRNMLRTDAELRKEQRALRKQRRQEGEEEH
ncbi:MAG: hypothetical protein WEC15_01345 [Flavobacteriales bacterium]